MAADYALKISSNFCAAHRLRGYVGKCERVHGHNYKVEVEISSQQLDQHGLAIDYFIIAKQLDLFIEQLDHQYLNEIAPFDRENPSAENIAKWFYKQLKAHLKQQSNCRHVQLDAVTLWETENFCVRYSEQTT